MHSNIPEYPNYHVTQDGLVFNIVTGKQLVGVPNVSSGYLTVALWNNGEFVRFYVHRLVATAYLDVPSLEKTFVNHIDHVKTNNCYTNLEWVTPQGNISAAIRHYKRHPMSRKLTYDTYLLIANRVIKGETLTALAAEYNVGLTNLSYHARDAAETSGIGLQYHEAILHRESYRKTGTVSPQRIKVTQLTLDGNFVATYDSLSEASSATPRTSCGSISNVLTGRTKTSGGYRWIKA